MRVKKPLQPLNYEIKLKIGLISADMTEDPWASAAGCELCSSARTFFRLQLLIDGGLPIPEDIYARYLLHGRKRKINFIKSGEHYSDKRFEKGNYSILICRKCEKWIVKKYK